MYHNETEIGIAIKESIEEGLCKREDLFIQTKAPFHFPGYNSAYKGLSESLDCLGLDYIDMYLIHHPYRNSLKWEREVIDVYCALENLYKEGKTKAIGVCNFSVPHLTYILKEAEIKPMINQIEFNPMRQQNEVVKFCNNNDIVIQSWGTLNQGRIFDYPVFNEIGKKYSKSASQVAIKYSLQKGNIALIRIGCEERMIENLNVFDFLFTEDEIQKLDSLNDGDFSNNHVDISLDVDMKYEYHPSVFTRIYKLFGLIPFFKSVGIDGIMKSGILWYTCFKN